MDSKLLNKALQTLMQRCVKILEVENNNYTPILIQDEEWDGTKLDEYFNWFLSNDMIHPEDIADFKKFTETLEGHVCYRRKHHGQWRWVVMELIDNILFVRDINEIYSFEYDSIVKKVGYIDSLTGLYNRLAYDKDIAEYHSGDIGVIFADVNGLKLINDEKGHSEGDKLIKEFANLLKSAFPDYKIYRIGGDEFVVLAFDVSLRSFIRRAVAWHKWLWSPPNEHPMASVGYSLGTENLKEIIEDAEKDMYQDKNIFYEKFPRFKR